MINRGMLLASIFSKINNNNKGEIMYNYKIDNETTDKVISSYNTNKSKKQINDLIDKINVIDSNYKNISIPEYEVPDFKRLEDIKIDSDSIKGDAEQSLLAYKNESINKITSDYEENKHNLNDAKEKLVSTELNKKQDEITKYNNTIKEKELKYKQTYDEFVADLKDDNVDNNNKLVELSAKYGSKIVSTYRKNQIFDALDSYFAGMDRASIIETLNTNNQLKSVLGGLLDEAIERYKK